MLGQAASNITGTTTGSNVAPDVNAQNAINTANANTPVSNNTIEPWSQDTLDTQNQLIKDGYGHLLGDTGADGRMGPKTREAIAARDKANASTEVNNNEKGAAQVDNSYMTPSYSNPFNRF